MSLRRERARVHATLAYWDHMFAAAEHRDPMEPLDVDALTRGAYEAGDAAYEACGRTRRFLARLSHSGSSSVGPCPEDVSFSGVDETTIGDPGKVWRCDGCGATGNVAHLDRLHAQARATVHNGSSTEGAR